ncbi:MAG: threonine--tRNA ligase [Candidatus Nomurabacteria bacterium]|nr:MAG: threonine--tRNA ligase [Candidatus Nomurabacteria bacterium]
MKEQAEKLQHIRHSFAHLLAAAVLRLWPDTKPTIGPAIENGFYYDFEFKSPISDKDLPKIEKMMRKTLQDWKGFERFEVSANEAKKEFKTNDFKLELIKDLEKEKQAITIYQSGHFRDLCRGGHVEDMKEMNPEAFGLAKTAGAYWRGDEKKPMLTRIYGYAFATKDELEAYKKMLEEAEKRDHRKLGQELDLFTFSEYVGAGLPLYTPRGTVLIREISAYLNELKASKGYDFVDIPHIAKSELYKTSGHWDKFKDGIFKVQGQSEEFVLKPMNCPHHTQIYASQLRSYRDLPLRYAEITKQYRDEQSGELHGLSRVRSITIDDTHIFCRQDQMLEEAKNAFAIIAEFSKTLGLHYRVTLSVRDPKRKKDYLGSDEVWEKAEQALAQVLKDEGQEFTVEEGEAAFYGPKIDFHQLDAIGRTWQLSTIQLDFNQPERFKLEYTDTKGEKVRPVMLHIAVAGSLERFLSIAIEHFAGAFPLWLSPSQVQLIPVTSKHEEFVLQMADEFRTQGIRVDVDLMNETVGNKIRKAIKRKVPYLLVIGDKELASPKLHVRKRGSEEVHEYTKKKFFEDIQEKIAQRSLEL